MTILEAVALVATVSISGYLAGRWLDRPWSYMVGVTIAVVAWAAWQRRKAHADYLKRKRS